MFVELRVSDGSDVCVVDLVAEPFSALEPPRQATIDDAAIAVDLMHEILTAKLTALLGRTELRDLVDVKALLDAGTDLAAALRDAPKKDDRPTGAGAGLDRRAGRRRRCVQAAVDRAVDPDRQTRLAPIQVGARLRNCLHGTRTRTNSS